MLHCSNMGSAFEDLHCTLNGAQFAVREPFQAQRQPGCGFWLRGKLVASGIGQPQFQTAAVGRVSRAFDQPGTDQRVDRAADGRGTAADFGGDLVEG